MMSLRRERIASAGLLTAVPDFAALRQVQDKVTAFRTLARLGLPQPRACVVTSLDALESIDELPVFVKTPVGTASAGVRQVTTRAELRQHAAHLDLRDGVLVQQPATGPLIMVQSVFASGELVAFHACERVREGTGGGASHKRGIGLPEVRAHTAALGTALNWHGALSADVILTAEGPGSSTSIPAWPSRRTRSRPASTSSAPSSRSPGQERAPRSLPATPACGPIRHSSRSLAPPAAGAAGTYCASCCAADPQRRLPAQHRGTDPRPLGRDRHRPDHRNPRRRRRPGHPHPPSRLAALRRRRHQRLLTQPGRLASATRISATRHHTARHNTARHNTARHNAVAHHWPR